MRKLTTVPNLAQCDLLKAVLESNGIECIVRNENLSTLSGDIPFLDAMPEIWVVSDEQFEEASEVLKKAKTRRREGKRIGRKK